MIETEFEFDLVCALPEDTDEGAILDALYEAGCDDAAVGLGASGLVGLGFTRAGQDPEAVISQTVKQVMTGLPRRDEAAGGEALVSLADVVGRLKVTRQALQKRQMPLPSLGGLYRASEMPHTWTPSRGAERRVPCRSGMVCRRFGCTTGKRQDQSCGARCSA